jgi:hypothetical protein
MPDIGKECKAQTKAGNRARRGIARMFGSGDEKKRRMCLIYGLVNRGSGVRQNKGPRGRSIAIWKNIAGAIK